MKCQAREMMPWAQEGRFILYKCPGCNHEERRITTGERMLEYYYMRMHGTMDGFQTRNDKQVVK